MADPLCPICESPMRVANRRDNGHGFWGCVRYPACKGTRSMKTVRQTVRGTPVDRPTRSAPPSVANVLWAVVGSIVVIVILIALVMGGGHAGG